MITNNFDSQQTVGVDPSMGDFSFDPLLPVPPSSAPARFNLALGVAAIFIS
jgi:hypothetical protein